MDKVKFAAAFVISAADSAVKIYGIDTYKTASAKLAGYKVELNLVSGDNTITVKYTKNSSTSQGNDSVYIYGIEIGNNVYR